jgi:hypothetical protein
LIGFTDDLGVLLLILGKLGSSVTPDIKKKAREHLHRWFGPADEAELDQLETQFSQGKR